MTLTVRIGILYILVFVLNPGHCVNKILFTKTNGLYLANSVIRTEFTNNEFECGAVCSKEIACVSVNYKRCGVDKGRCELNDDSIERSPPENRLVDMEFCYLGVRNSVRFDVVSL